MASLTTKSLKSLLKNNVHADSKQFPLLKTEQGQRPSTLPSNFKLTSSKMNQESSSFVELSSKRKKELQDGALNKSLNMTDLIHNKQPVKAINANVQNDEKVAELKGSLSMKKSQELKKNLKNLKHKQIEKNEQIKQTKTYIDLDFEDKQSDKLNDKKFPLRVSKRLENKKRNEKNGLKSREILESFVSNGKKQGQTKQLSFQNKRCLNVNIKPNLKRFTKDDLINLSETNKNVSELRKRNISEINESFNSSAIEQNKKESSKDIFPQSRKKAERKEDSLSNQNGKAPENTNNEIDIQKMALPCKKVFNTCLSEQIIENVKNPCHTVKPQQNYPSCFPSVQNSKNSFFPSKAPLPSSQINTINFIPVSLNSSNVENNSALPICFQNFIPINPNSMQPQNQSNYASFQFSANNNSFPVSYQCPQSQPAYILLNNDNNGSVMPVNPRIHLANSLTPVNLNQNNGFVQGQVIPQNNPIVILMDKSILIPNQNLSILNTVPIQQVQQREQIPIQIQYHTNIYCPNSNNNLFTLDSMRDKKF